MISRSAVPNVYFVIIAINSAYEIPYTVHTPHFIHYISLYFVQQYAISWKFMPRCVISPPHILVFIRELLKTTNRKILTKCHNCATKCAIQNNLHGFKTSHSYDIKLKFNFFSSLSIPKR